MPHFPEAFGPAEKGQMSNTAQTGDNEAYRQAGRKIKNQREQPRPGGNTRKKMADDQIKTLALDPFALRSEVRLEIFDQLFIARAAGSHNPILDSRV